tara:strand:+ start:66 stop:332 length:267 start_codon:yes stop_codon:yes gene_type:complete
MNREQLSYLLRLVKGGMLERATTMIEQELAKPEQKPVCNKDPSLCGFVQCQLGKVCKHTAQPDLSIEANRVAYDVAMHYANKTKEKNT